MTSLCGSQSVKINLLSHRTVQGHPAVQRQPTVLGSLWPNLEQKEEWRFCSLTQPERWIVLPAPIPTLTPPGGDFSVRQQAKDPGLPLTQRTPSCPLPDLATPGRLNSLFFSAVSSIGQAPPWLLFATHHSASHSQRQRHPILLVKKSSFQELKPSSQIYLADGKAEVQNPKPHFCALKSSSYHMPASPQPLSPFK